MVDTNNNSGWASVVKTIAHANDVALSKYCVIYLANTTHYVNETISIIRPFTTIVGQNGSKTFVTTNNGKRVLV